jgi:hypothetical protein
MLTTIARQSKMRLLLLVFVLQVIAVTSANNNLLTKLNREQKLEIIAESQQQIPTNKLPGKLKSKHVYIFILAGPFCQSLIAHFVGTFRSKDTTTSNFSAQFRILLDADLKKKRITVGADQWNEQFANSKEFGLDFYYSGNYQW